MRPRKHLIKPFRKSYRDIYTGKNEEESEYLQDEVLGDIFRKYVVYYLSEKYSYPLYFDFYYYLSQDSKHYEIVTIDDFDAYVFTLFTQDRLTGKIKSKRTSLNRLQGYNLKEVKYVTFIKDLTVKPSKKFFYKSYFNQFNEN
jgi:hypothetical protein